MQRQSHTGLAIPRSQRFSLQNLCRWRRHGECFTCSVNLAASVMRAVTSDVLVSRINLIFVDVTVVQSTSSRYWTVSRAFQLLAFTLRGFAQQCLSYRTLAVAEAVVGSLRRKQHMKRLMLNVRTAERAQSSSVGGSANDGDRRSATDALTRKSILFNNAPVLLCLFCRFSRSTGVKNLLQVVPFIAAFPARDRFRTPSYLRSIAYSVGSPL